MLFFGEDDLADAFGVLDELGIGDLHLVAHGLHHLEHERLLLAEEAAVANAATENLAQDVAAAFVGRLNAIGDQEGGGPGVVGDDSQRRRTLGIANGSFSNGHGGKAGQLSRTRDQRGEEVRLVVRQDSLQNAGDPFETHAGVDRRLGKRRQHAVAGAVELHEDKVPDLHVALVVLSEGQVSPGLRGLEPEVEVDLGTGSAGPGIAHRPEVVLGSEFVDALGRHANVEPELVGLGVAGYGAVAFEDGYVHPLAIDAKPGGAGQQLPGKSDRVFLEVVAEGEVSQHLEEGVVPPREADVFEVVMLAAGAYTLLRGGRARVGALLGTKEDVLELVHPRVGKEQRGVVGRHQRRRMHTSVLFTFKKPQKIFANLTARPIVHSPKVYQRTPRQLPSQPHLL